MSIKERQKDRQSERYLGIFNISPTLPLPLTYPSLKDTLFQPGHFNADNFFPTEFQYGCLHVHKEVLFTET